MKNIKYRLTLLGLRIYLNVLALFAPSKAGAIALQIFCTPRRGRLREKDRQFLNTADEQQELLANGLSVRCYHWRGPGDTVLLVHGWESNSARWYRVVRQLRAKGFNVVAVDAPAHGQSGGREFNALLYARALQVAVEHYKPQSLVGHSIGGFASLLLLHTGQAPSVQQLAILGTPSEMTRVVAGYQRTLGLSDRVIQAMEDVFRRRFGYVFADFSGPTIAGQLSLDGLIVHDLNDETVPYVNAEAYAAHWPQARLVTTRSQGHRLNGDGVPETIVRFLQGAVAVV